MGLVGRTLSLDVRLKILETLLLFKGLLTALSPVDPIPAHLLSKVSDRASGDFTSCSDWNGTLYFVSVSQHTTHKNWTIFVVLASSISIGIAEWHGFLHCLISRSMLVVLWLPLQINVVFISIKNTLASSFLPFTQRPLLHDWTFKTAPNRPTQNLFCWGRHQLEQPHGQERHSNRPSILLCKKEWNISRKIKSKKKETMSGQVARPTTKVTQSYNRPSEGNSSRHRSANPNP